MRCLPAGPQARRDRRDTPAAVRGVAVGDVPRVAKEALCSVIGTQQRCVHDHVNAPVRTAQPSIRLTRSCSAGRVSLSACPSHLDELACPVCCAITVSPWGGMNSGAKASTPKQPQSSRESFQAHPFRARTGVPISQPRHLARPGDERNPHLYRGFEAPCAATSVPRVTTHHGLLASQLLSAGGLDFNGERKPPTGRRHNS